jgi:hypothetical protein
VPHRSGLYGIFKKPWSAGELLKRDAALATLSATAGAAAQRRRELRPAEAGASKS